MICGGAGCGAVANSRSETIFGNGGGSAPRSTAMSICSLMTLHRPPARHVLPPSGSPCHIPVRPVPRTPATTGGVATTLPPSIRVSCQVVRSFESAVLVKQQSLSRPRLDPCLAALLPAGRVVSVVAALTQRRQVQQARCLRLLVEDMRHGQHNAAARDGMRLAVLCAA